LFLKQTLGWEGVLLQNNVKEKSFKNYPTQEPQSQKILDFENEHSPPLCRFKFRIIRYM
jgi:hypothetical protein